MRRLNLALWLLFTLLAPSLAPAQATEFIYETATARHLSVGEFAASVKAGEILVIGEKHALAGDAGSAVHQGHQVDLLYKMSDQMVAKNQRLFVGMEFLEYPKQSFVDDYLYGNLNETDFLKAVDWGSSPFELYRQQILAPTWSMGRTLALNIPREVTAQVAKDGLGSLNQQQRAFLPPTLTRGNDLYFERFSTAMGGHVSPEKIADYFWAQSIWDETMAWQSLEGRSDDAVLAIIVGEFHVEYGGGLPDRLRARGASVVKTLVQRKLAVVDDASVEAAVAADPKYGAVADYIWIY